MLADQMLLSQQTEGELNRIVEERAVENQKLDQQLKSVEVWFSIRTTPFGASLAVLACLLVGSSE